MTSTEETRASLDGTADTAAVAMDVAAVATDTSEMAAVATEAAATTTAPATTRRDPSTTWSRPVDRLAVGEVPAEAMNLNVTGRRLVGPVQGFGQLWQKVYRIRLDGADASAQDVVRVWKDEFATFWPGKNRFYGPLTGIAPGEVALLNLAVPGRQTLSTGVMVIYADDESFTFMTPEGHMFAAWITFSAAQDADGPFAQVQVLLRAGDPFYELTMMLGGHRQENTFWLATLRNLAARFGVTAEPTMEQTLVDGHRQWRYVRNLRHNAAIRSGIWTMTHPGRLFRRSTGR